jgi:hypothetical protein
MMKTFLRSFFSSPPAESPAREVGTGRTESSISANWVGKEASMGRKENVRTWEKE